MGDFQFRYKTPGRRYIPKNKKHEESLQLRVCKYIRQNYPGIVFRSDYASGLKLTKNQAVQHSRLQSGRGFPDIFIFAPSVHGDRTYYGCGIELKADGTSVIMKIGPRKGMLSLDEHIQEQAMMMRELNRLGYYANFAVGYDAAIKIIDWYFRRAAPINGELF